MDKRVKHGMSGHKMYSHYINMMARCYNESYRHSANYKKKKIEVCDEWRSDIKSFLAWAESTFIEGCSIDRIDNSKGYSQENCRWTNKTIQSRNTQPLQSNNKSGYRGVCYDNTHKHWIAYIKINGKQNRIGRYKTKEEAHEAYKSFVDNNKLEHNYK